MTDTITLPRAIVEQALSALPWSNGENIELKAQLRAALEQPEAKPVAFVSGTYGGHPTLTVMDHAAVLPYGLALYRHPRPDRHPLTVEEVDQLREDIGGGEDSPDPWSFMCGIRTAERAHNIGGKK